MKKTIAAVVSVVVFVGGMAQTSPVAAATTWDFAGGSFTLSDGYRGSGTVAIQNVQVVGTSASGNITLANGGRSSCSTRSFSGLTATFTLDGQYNPCYGTVTFAVDPTGLLTVIDSSVYIPSTLLNGPGTGALQGVAQKPVVVPLQNCTATSDPVAQGINFSWTETLDATAYSVVLNPATTAILPAAQGGKVQVPFSSLTPGTLYSATVTAMRSDGETVATCSTNGAWTPPAKPVVVSIVTVAPSGLLTVNYALPDPTGVQGIEYMLDGGTWTRPGGVAPVNGTGGSFTVAGLTSKDLTLTLRTVGEDAGGPLASAGAPVQVSFAKAPTVKPVTVATPTGSSSTAPVPAPPAAPVSQVSGTSNGAGSGANGALAASTGDAGIDAPCLAQDGTLYPNQYSTVGSQLTMAPNTHGMGRVKAFTVVAGALPPGMQLDRTFGVLFGVTSQQGSWVTTIKAKFADGSAKSSQFTTRVDADPQTLQYAAQNIGSVGAGIVIAPTTNAPLTGTTYALVCGKLPAGTRFDSRTGAITGKPTDVVLLPTPLRVAETSPAGTAAASFIFVVNKAGTTTLSYPAHPHVRAGKRVVIRPTIAGVGDIAVIRMWKGKLPKGLRLNTRTGVIRGRIAHAGPTHTITIVAETKGGALLTAAPMRLRLKR